MSDNHNYLAANENSNFRLRADVFLLMMKGASYAAIGCLALWLIVYVFVWIGQMLPDESRETEDPTPFSYNLTAPHITAEV